MVSGDRATVVQHKSEAAFSTLEVTAEADKSCFEPALSAALLSHPFIFEKFLLTGVPQLLSAAL